MIYFIHSFIHSIFLIQILIFFYFNYVPCDEKLELGGKGKIIKRSERMNQCVIDKEFEKFRRFADIT